jgi:hypothetical protein
MKKIIACISEHGTRRGSVPPSPYRQARDIRQTRSDSNVSASSDEREFFDVLDIASLEYLKTKGVRNATGPQTVAELLVHQEDEQLRQAVFLTLAEFLLKLDAIDGGDVVLATVEATVQTIKDDYPGLQADLPQEIDFEFYQDDDREVLSNWQIGLAGIITFPSLRDSQDLTSPNIALDAAVEQALTKGCSLIAAYKAENPQAVTVSDEISTIVTAIGELDSEAKVLLPPDTIRLKARLIELGAYLGVHYDRAGFDLLASYTQDTRQGIGDIASKALKSCLEDLFIPKNGSYMRTGIHRTFGSDKKQISTAWVYIKDRLIGSLYFSVVVGNCERHKPRT